MARTWRKGLILLMWLALPASTWVYWNGWDRLPARMAVHFDANWQPNGYTSRDGALQLGIGILLVMLVLLTITTLIIDALKPQAFWPGNCDCLLRARRLLVWQLFDCEVQSPDQAGSFGDGEKK
jgi:Protein of unknown function (DUF1648)